MKVRILLFPLSLVISLFVSIRWIQPEISRALTLRNERANERQKLEKIEQVVSNVDSLTKSLNENVGNENFVRTYLPETGGDDRVIDEINYLAGDSGVLLVSLGAKRIESERTLAAEATVSASADQAEIKSASPSQAIFSGDSASETTISFIDTKPMDRLRSTEVSVSVIGRYEQIRDFVDRIYRANYFQNFLKVSITKKALVDSKGESIPASSGSEALSGNFIIRFGWLPNEQVATGTFLEAFNRSQFDFGIVQELRSRATREISPLLVSPVSRPNPFLR